MDLQVWFYIIIAVIVVLRGLMKKPDNQPQDLPESKRQERQPRYEAKPQQERPRAQTFEELLREITEAKQRSETVYEAPRREAEVVDYDDNVEAEERSLEEVGDRYNKKDTQYDVYENVRASTYERASLEETMNIKNTEVEFGKFKVFEQEKKRSLIEEYKLDFKDRNDLKKAIVMSEILNRKF